MKQRPECVGFIMDGNRRWATANSRAVVEGHRQGLKVFEQAVRWLRDERISHGVFYAFSTENWKRNESEVEALLALFSATFDSLKKGSSEDSVAVRIIGRRQDFSPQLQLDMAELEARTKQYQSGTTIWVALSYGGRAEIVDAVNRAVAIGELVTEANFSKLLHTAGMPDPDIIVRTSGEERLSNFLPWQSVYSELYFLDKNWPALTPSDFKDILATYEKRTRRCGA
jgi:undecaprenyl diphosphate synthase